MTRFESAVRDELEHFRAEGFKALPLRRRYFLAYVYFMENPREFGEAFNLNDDGSPGFHMGEYLRALEEYSEGESRSVELALYSTAALSAYIEAPVNAIIEEVQREYAADNNHSGIL